MRATRTLVVLGVFFCLTAVAEDWQRDLPVFDSGSVSSTRSLRTLIHMHSVFSHDACDGNPQKDRKINQACLKRFREALCRNHIDVTFLTEHKKSMAAVDFNLVLVPQAGDRPIFENGQMVGVLQSCSDGHEVLVLPGAENNLMPLGLARHPDPLDGNLSWSYSGMDEAAVERFRQAGALVAVPHTEEKAVDYLKQIKPDAVEIYNLHANLKGILDDSGPFDFISKLSLFMRFLVDPTLEPDLIFLVFFKEALDPLKKWAQLVLDHPAVGIAGTDAHENSFFNPLWDGERLDGYRRNTRWFSNILEVPGPGFARADVMESLKAGRSYVAFEVFGTPQGFRFFGERADGSKIRMGDQVNLAGSKMILRVTTPVPLQNSFRKPALVTPQILKATPDGWKIVGNASTYEVKEPGVYRAEVRIKPRHLGEFLPGAVGLIRDYPWIYSNPIYVR